MSSKTTLRSLIAVLAASIALIIIVIAALLYNLTSGLRNVDRPIDARQFNTDRRGLSEDLPDDQIMPLQLGNFTRIELIDNVSTLEYERELIAVYVTEDGRQVDLGAYLSISHADDQDFLGREARCGDCLVNTPSVHMDTDISYAYDYCGCMSYAFHQLRWINGNWRLTASASSNQAGDGKTLLSFLSTYPF